MKVIKINKKVILIIVLIAIFIAVVTKVTTSFGIQNYYNLDFSTGLVTASTLNVISRTTEQTTRL